MGSAAHASPAWQHPVVAIDTKFSIHLTEHSCCLLSPIKSSVNLPKACQKHAVGRMPVRGSRPESPGDPRSHPQLRWTGHTPEPAARGHRRSQDPSAVAFTPQAKQALLCSVNHLPQTSFCIANLAFAPSRHSGIFISFLFYFIYLFIHFDIPETQHRLESTKQAWHTAGCAGPKSYQVT